MANYITILGIDPGTARTGYGVITLYDDNRIQFRDCGIISTPAHTPHSERLCTIRADYIALLRQFAPQEIAMELLMFSNNAKSCMLVAESRGVLIQAAAEHRPQTPQSQYHPPKIKKDVSGNGRADKKEMTAAIVRLLCLNQPPSPDDAADGLAIAYCRAIELRGAENLRPIPIAGAHGAVTVRKLDD